MRSYPATQRAIAAVLEDAIEKAGETPTGVARAMGGPENAIRRVLTLGRDISLAETIHLAKLLGVKPARLVERIERRLLK